MAGVTLGEPHQRRGRLGRDGEGQHHAGAGPDPQQVLARQESRDPQAGCLVLPDNGIRACRASPPSAFYPDWHGVANPADATGLHSRLWHMGRGEGTPQPPWLV